MLLICQRSGLSSKSRFGEKLAYVHRHRDGLQFVLTDGRVELDTNVIENTICPITLNCKKRPVRWPRRGRPHLGTHGLADRDLQPESRRPLRLPACNLGVIANGHPKSQIENLMPRAYTKTSRTEQLNRSRCEIVGGGTYKQSFKRKCKRKQTSPLMLFRTSEMKKRPTGCPGAALTLLLACLNSYIRPRAKSRLKSSDLIWLQGDAFMNC
jgi:hypothetical protein